jgi:hypothetical protein
MVPVEMDSGNNGMMNNDEQTTTTKPPPRFYTQAARQTTWREFWRNVFSNDVRTILITILVIILMNVPYVHWVMYPFTVYSTWIHELCHAMAALMAGGTVEKLELFPDTSGLATAHFTKDDRLPFFASAGYQGTAVIGMLLLMVRRTKRGPRAGTMAIAILMLISVAVWVRNTFGILFLLGMGITLCLAAWFFTSMWIRNLYVVLAVTCVLNAITSVGVLFGDKAKVNGEDVPSDAESMADLTGGSRTTWASIWLGMALGMALLGFLFAIPGPGESAEFTICGMCQDCGCFYLWNAEGKRFWANMRGTNKTDTAAPAAADATNVV